MSALFSRRHPSRWLTSSGWIVLISCVGFLVLWPLVALEWQALGHGLDDFRTVYLRPGIASIFVNTVILALSTTVFALIAGTGLAWCAVHLPPRARSMLAVLPMLPLVVPAVAGITGWVFLASPRVGYLNEALRLLPMFAGRSQGPLDVFTPVGIIFVSGLLLTSFMYLFVYNGLGNISLDYEAAAAIAGASPIRSFLTVTLPLLRPSVVYGAAITLMLSLGQFAAPLLLGTNAKFDVLTTTLFNMLQVYPPPYGQAAALGLPLLVAGAAVLVAQRRIIGDLQKYRLLPRSAASDRGSPLAVIVVVLYATIAVLLPIAALTYVALSPYWIGEVTLRLLTLQQVRDALFENPYLRSAIANSLEAVALTVVIVLPVSYFIAKYLAGRSRAPKTATRALDLFVLLPFGTPAVLYGFALLFAYTRPPFVLYGTLGIIIVAFATVMIPYGVRLQLATLLALGEDPWSAASVCGASPLRVFRTITLPLLRRGTSAAAAIMFVLLFQEFGVSLMVRSPGTQVIGSVLYDQYASGIYPTVSVLALVMVAISTLGVLIVLVGGGADNLTRRTVP